MEKIMSEIDYRITSLSIKVDLLQDEVDRFNAKWKLVNKVATVLIFISLGQFLLNLIHIIVSK